MEWVRLKTYNDLNKARLIKSKLDSFGIPNYISNENFSGLYGGILSVDLFVQKAALKDAISLLEEKEITTELQCPNCQSTNIRENRVIRSKDAGKPMYPEDLSGENMHSYRRFECEVCAEVWLEEDEDVV